MGKWRGFAADLGASNGRTVLGEFDGERITLSEVSRFPNAPMNLGDTLYWNFLGLYHEVVAGLRQSCSQGRSPVTMGIDSWAVDFGLLDAYGELMGNPRHYRDHHNDGMPEKVFSRISPETIYKQTGIQVIQINTIYQLMYLRLHRPEMLNRARHFLLIPDLIHYFLTGVKVSEFTNATTTQLFNPSAGDWARDLMAGLDLSAEIFPPIVPPFQVIGSVRTEILAGNGGREIKAVTVGEHDTASAVFAVPHGFGNFAYISSGTWSLVGILSPEPLISELTRKYNFTNEGGVAGDYRVLKNVTGLWLVQEVKRKLDEAGQVFTYADLTALAARAQPLQAIIDPDAPDFLAPENMIIAVQVYCLQTGQKKLIEPGEICRIIFESLALKYRWVIERLEQVTGHALDVIHIVGGGVHNGLLCQMTADATGKLVVAGPVEATVIGNICAQLIAVRELGGVAEVPGLVRRSFETQTYEPTKERSCWDEAYRKLLHLLLGQD